MLLVYHHLLKHQCLFLYKKIRRDKKKFTVRCLLPPQPQFKERLNQIGGLLGWRDSPGQSWASSPPEPLTGDVKGEGWCPSELVITWMHTHIHTPVTRQTFITR